MKSIFRSRVFWFNVLTCGAHFAGYIPVPYTVPAVALINIALRYVTVGPVSLTGE